MIINRITKCVLMTLFLFIVGGQCQAKDYSPEELLLLMKTSCQRYKTMNAQVEATYYKGHDESGKRITQRTQEIIYRWTPDRYYSEVNERYIDRPIDMRENILYKKATTGKWTKTLMIRHEGHPRGTIELGRESLDKFTNPNCAMWDINQMGIPMDKTGIDLNRASVETDKTTGYLVMKFRLGEHEKAAQVVLYIDPTRDYIPIINEFKRCDGRLITRQTCKLHRNPDGLWIPEEYSWEDPEADYLAVHKIKKIEINTTIPEELLNFEFPNGTYVLDKIQNLKYIKGPSSPREPKSLIGKSLPDLKDLGINLSPAYVMIKRFWFVFLITSSDRREIACKS